MRLSAGAFIAAALGRFKNSNRVAAIYEGLSTNHTGNCTTTPSKGKRSRKRRAAKMRAKGFVNHDGMGWISPEEYWA